MFIFWVASEKGKNSTLRNSFETQGSAHETEKIAR